MAGRYDMIAPGLGHGGPITIRDQPIKNDVKVDGGIMLASLKHIDKKFTEKGQIYYAETVEETIPEQIDWWGKYALCLVRSMDRTNKIVTTTSLQINSQHLKDVLKKTIGDYPGLSFLTKDVTISAPYRVLYHYRHELKEAKDSLPIRNRDEAAAHLELLLDFINEQFKDTINECDNLLPQGLVTYEHLWTIFRPGSKIYSPVLGRARVFTLVSYIYSCIPGPHLVLSANFVDFDGDKFGTRTTSRDVYEFSGAKKVTDLAAYPVEMHSDSANLRKQLVERGRRFEALTGVHFNRYNSIALEPSALGYSRYNVDGRVVIDTKTFHRMNADLAFSVLGFHAEKLETPKKRSANDKNATAMLEVISQHRPEIDPLTDEQAFQCNALVRGYSFSEKRWLDFFIDKCTPVDWNPRCFDQLVLPEAQKDLVQALVANYAHQKHGFDDIVKGKGQGLIFVLHGPPGVGKTLTAETVAEYCKRPLYSVSSGDLGSDASTLDERLSRILDMASTWKAVLLIDEADVFLERRSLHDMGRNGLVSIFLRVLEYYEGILFLTSNRVATFDEAFKSRIHVPLKYGDLTVESRKVIWKNLLAKLETEGREALGEAGLENLAEVNINGRVIKNVIRTANSLAQFRGEELRLDILKEVIKMQMEFEKDLMSGESNS